MKGKTKRALVVVMTPSCKWPIAYCHSLWLLAAKRSIFTRPSPALGWRFGLPSPLLGEQNSRKLDNTNEKNINVILIKEAMGFVHSHLTPCCL